MEVLASAAEGFLLAAEAFCKLPEELQKELCSTNARHVLLLGALPEFSSDAMFEHAVAIGCHCDRQSVDGAFNLILHIYRAALRLNLDGKQLADQFLTSSVWTPSSVAIVKNAWTKQLEKTPPASQLANIGQLVDMEWSFGMSMASSCCRNLNSPFISVLLKVAEPSGKIVCRSFEMTLPEFRNFSQQIREMAHTMETA